MYFKSSVYYYWQIWSMQSGHLWIFNFQFGPSKLKTLIWQFSVFGLKIGVRNMNWIFDTWKCYFPISAVENWKLRIGYVQFLSLTDKVSQLMRVKSWNPLTTPTLVLCKCLPKSGYLRLSNIQFLSPNGKLKIRQTTAHAGINASKQLIGFVIRSHQIRMGSVWIV